MKRQFLSAVSATIIGLTMLSSQSFSQQKTAKECQKEWRANKAANQSNGLTEKAYVRQCRSAAATAEPTPPSPPATAPSENNGGKKTTKACRDEWKANKAANKANGVTEKAYVEQCKAGAAPPLTTTAPATAPPPPRSTAPTSRPTSSPTATAPQAAPLTAPTRPARPAPIAPIANPSANEFSTESQAKAHCPADTIVWANLRSRVYHFTGTRYYGATEKGAYMCERDATGAGVRAAKNEKHP
jgi:hypothetical protein